MKTSKELVCAGSVALDTTITAHGKVVDALGGACTFSSIAASFFCPVHMVSVVGSDFPKAHWDEFKALGIDLEGVQVVEGGKTFSYESEFTHDFSHRKSLRTDLNVLADFTPTIPGNARQCGYAYLATMPPAKQAYALSQLEDPQLVFLDTIEFFIENNRAELLELVSKVDGFVINDAEARQLTGEHSLVKAGRKIGLMGPRIVVIKKGEHGCLLFFGGKTYPFPAFPLEEIVDPTGAGDSFSGGMMGYLASKGVTRDKVDAKVLREAVAYGAVMGSFAVEGFSIAGIKRAARKGEIAKRMAEYSMLAGHLAQGQG